MPNGLHKVGDTIEVTYTARKDTSGLTDVTMEIYDETGNKDTVNFPDVVMTEISTTGSYKGSFVPDAQGKWRVMIDSATKSGRVEKDYDVTGHNIHSIGEAIANLESLPYIG